MTSNEKRSLIIRAGNACERAIHELGLRTYPQVFEIVHDMEQWHALISHSVLEQIFSNHHFGRSFEYLRIKSQWSAAMAIEVVTNENPCRGYLCMPIATPLLVLSQAHALAHNNFFRINRWMYQAQPDAIARQLLEDAGAIERIRATIGRDEVTDFLDACRYLMWHKDRMPRIECIGEDLLRFFLHHGALNGWQQKIIQTIIRLSDYLYAILMTKMANEGYASYLELPILERAFSYFAAPRQLIAECRRYHHTLITSPPLNRIASSPSPYWIGHVVWKHLAASCASLSELERYSATIDDDAITNDLLNTDMLNELERAIEYSARAKNAQTDFLSHDWIKSILRISFGTSAIPRIFVADICHHNGVKDLHLQHSVPEDIHGVELNIQYARHCLTAIESHLWKWGKVYLISKRANGKKLNLRGIR